MKPLVLAVALASLLGGVVLGLTATLPAARIAGPLLAAWALAAAAALLKGRPKFDAALLAPCLGILALLASHLRQLPAPVPLRTLQVAATLSFGAIVAASVLRLLRITDWSRALLAGFSLAIPILLADASLPPAPPIQATRWNVSTRPDPDTEFRYMPNSTAQNFYPDNPRGYFERAEPAVTWSIETHAGNEAQLEFPEAGNRETMRITISKLVRGEAWQVKVKRGPLNIKPGRRYRITFYARAAATRPVRCAVGQNHAPWELIGEGHEFEVGTEWSRFECPFRARMGDPNARVFFDLAKSDVPLDLRDVVVTEDATGRSVMPPVEKPQFLINYRFNSLGLRGPDRAIPAPPGTFRIVALGDSYAMGVGVKEGDTVEAQLEKRLNAGRAARGGKTVYEVINDGVSGYDTRQERMSFEKYSSEYQPNVVLLLMVFNDDLSYNEDFRNGQLALPSKAARLYSLWSLVESARNTRVYDYSGSISEVRELDQACRRRGAKLAVAIFRNSAYFPWMKLVRDVTEGLKGSGIPVVDLGTALLKDRDPRELAVHAIDLHPNEIAHRLAAEELERFLRSEQLIR